MKYINLLLITFSLNLFSETTYNILENEPPLNSPSSTAVKYIKALKSGDSNKVIPLLDDEFKKPLTANNNQVLKMFIKHFSTEKHNLEKEFIITEYDPKNSRVRINLKSHKCSIKFYVKRYENKWLITKMEE